MLHQMITLPTAIPVAGARACPTGFVEGTLIATDEGDLPVEHLLAGDMIRTHTGESVQLRGTNAIDTTDVDLVVIKPIALGCVAHRPGAELVVPATHPVMVRDWRARLLHGNDWMMTPASSLVDDLLVRRETRAKQRLFRLHFDRPEIIWANGIQVGSARRYRALQPTLPTFH